MKRKLTVGFGGFIVVKWLVVEESSQVSWFRGFEGIEVVDCHQPLFEDT
jgi:hypothetical protein